MTDATERYRGIGRPLEDAIAGLDEAAWHARAAEGEWSAAEIVHHLADAETIQAGRLRLILARDGAPIAAFEEGPLVAASDAAHRSVPESLALLRAVHAANLDLLEHLHPESWKHAGDHEEYGRLDIDGWVQRSVDHVAGHAAQIAATVGGR